MIRPGWEYKPVVTRLYLHASGWRVQDDAHQAAPFVWVAVAPDGVTHYRTPAGRGWQKPCEAQAYVEVVAKLGYVPLDYQI